MIRTKIIASLLMFAVGAFMSGMMFPPGNVARQFAIVILWYGMGMATALLWKS